VQFKLHKVLIH